MSYNNIITVSHQQACNIILSERSTTTVHLVGEPGIGKTQLTKMLEARTGYQSIIIDCPSKADISDFGTFVPDRETKSISFWGNPYYDWCGETPRIYDLDEYTKGSNMVKTMLHGLYDPQRRIGDILINPESIVYSTGNLGTDGVGDVKQAHTQGRITELYLRKPNAEEWCTWGVGTGVNPIVLSWVEREPSLLASYLDAGQEDNPYIFNPKRAASSINKAYVSPRSLFKAAAYVTACMEGRLTEHEMLAALQGCIGAAASRSLAAHVAVANEVPSPREIVRDPMNATVPKQPGAVSITAFGAIMWLSEVCAGRLNIDGLTKGEVMHAWLTYLPRLPKEAQSLYMATVYRSGTAQGASRAQVELWETTSLNPKFNTWAQANMHLFK